MTKLYVVRHGETDWNIENRTQGAKNDLPLNDKGKAQAAALAQRFKNIEVDYIYSSDLKRAYQTAYEISIVKNVKINTDSRLREMNFGIWEGLTSKDIAEKYGSIFEVWRSNPKECSIPDGETLLMLQERVLKSIDEIINNHKGKNIVIVSHGITCKVLILSVLGMDLSYENRLRMDNTGLSILKYKELGPVVELLNDTCHLGGNLF